MVRNIFGVISELSCWIVVAMLCIWIGSFPARAAQPGPVGAWVTSGNGAVIEIYQCGVSLCGAISGIVLAPTVKTPVDWQGQSQCELVIVRTAAEPVQGATSAWFGSITNPRNGSVYHARLTLDANGNLLLRGYLGLPVFGKTQTWTRYDGATPPSDCRLRTTATQTSTTSAAALNG